MRRLIALSLLICGLLSAQLAHPRIWLDTPTKTRLQALVAAKDPTWIAFKAQADGIASYAVAPYANGGCTARTICYAGLSPYDGNSYAGSGWLISAQTLGLAYQMTGATKYSSKLREVAAAMVAAGVTPISRPSTAYSSRSVALALGLIYDWIYPELSTQEKADLCALGDINYNYVQSLKNGATWGNSMNAYGNFFGGHLVGLGISALAMEGDNVNAQEQIAFLQATAWNKFVVPAFTTGGLQGGYPAESYNYGTGHNLSLLRYAEAYRTAGKGDLGGSNYAAAMAKSLIYNLQPDQWSITMEGAYPGQRHVLNHQYPHVLAGLLRDRTEGGWMKWMCQHLAPVPGTKRSGFHVGAFDAFFYNTKEVTPVDYTATEPLSYFSPGDKHTYARTDWTTSAVETTFAAGAVKYTDHQNKNAGHIALQRGGDFLLINSGEWNLSKNATHPAQYAIDGTPETYDDSNQESGRMNSLYYWDGGSANAGRCLHQVAAYDGCLGAWGKEVAVTHKEPPEYAYSKADLRTAYNAPTWPEWSTSINAYERSFLSIDGVSFVFDRINVTSATATRVLRWHFNSEATNSITGNVVKSSVGESNLFVVSVLPAGSSIALVDEPKTFGGTDRITTRADISDPAVSADTRLLTVLAPTASSVSSVPPTNSIAATGFVGALYADATPRVALFSDTGEARSGVTYSITASGTVRHVIADLAPGTYAIRQNGTALASQTVGADGTLAFTSTDGGNFAVSSSMVVAPTITSASPTVTGDARADAGR